MATMQVDIVAAEGEIFSGEAAMVFAPASQGDVGIAPRHAPLLTKLRPGDLRVQTPEGEEKFFYVTGGILEVQPHVVTVMADSALHGEALDVEEGEAHGLAGHFGEGGVGLAGLEAIEAAGVDRVDVAFAVEVEGVATVEVEVGVEHDATSSLGEIV